MNEQPGPSGDEPGVAGVGPGSRQRWRTILAVVLIVVGIGSTFKLHTIRYALTSVGSLLLVLATVLLLRQPGLPG